MLTRMAMKNGVVAVPQTAYDAIHDYEHRFRLRSSNNAGQVELRRDRSLSTSTKARAKGQCPLTNIESSKGGL